MKRLVSVGCALCTMLAMAGYDDEYTAATGYVTFSGSNWRSGTPNNLDTATGWSDGKPPHSDSNYYIKVSAKYFPGYIFDKDFPPFQGRKLVVGGQIVQQGQANSYMPWGDTLFLPGSEYFMYCYPNVNSGVFTITGTAEKPVNFSFSSTSLCTWPVAADFRSDPTGYAVFRQRTDCPLADYPYGLDMNCTGDWSQYFGTMFLHQNWTFRHACPRIPGTIVLSAKDSKMQFTGTSGEPMVGTLKMGTGSSVHWAYSSSQVLFVSNRLEVADGVTMKPHKVSGHALCTEATPVPFLKLSGEAVAAGVPDFEKIVVNDTSKYMGPIPRVKVTFEDADDGAKVACASYYRYVSLTNGNGQSAFCRTGSWDGYRPENYWNDGQYPVAGTDYFSGWNTLVRPDEADAANYVFPGNLLVFVYNLGLYCNTTMRIIAAARDGGGFSEGHPHPKLYLVGNRKTFFLRGGLELVDMADPSASTKTSKGLSVAVGDANTMLIESDISGKGFLAFYLASVSSESHKDATIWNGCVDLSGDNRKFLDKMIVKADLLDSDNGYFPATPAFEPGPSSNVTLRVHAQKNLGGSLPSFAFDALTVSNECRLVLADTATYDDATRGWFFPRKAYLGVLSNSVAKVQSTVTLGGELVKEDPGSVIFSALAQENDADTKKITVRGGAIGAASATVFDGIPLDFATGAGLAVEAHPADQTFAARGFTYTDVSKLTSAGTITVTITGVADWTEGFVPFTVGICTVPTAQAATLAGKMRAKKPAKGIGAKIVTIDNGDGTTTIAANCDRFGMVLLVR